MKKLKEQLKAVTKSLKDLGKQVDKAVERLEKLEKGTVTKKAVAKKKTVARKAPAKKKAVVKKAPVKKTTAKKQAAAVQGTVLDIVLSAIEKNPEGASIAELKNVSQLEARQLSNALYKLSKRGKIKTKTRGVYIPA